MAPLGIAIIGGGIFVREEHLPAVLACELVTLKAIWSRSLKSAEQTAKLIPDSCSSAVDLYSMDSGEGKSYDDLLKRPDIAGVIIALPIPDQPNFIKKALAAGKHALAEKPIAPDIARAQELIDYSRKISAKTKATLAIAENFRFNPGWTYGAEQIKQLGKVTGFVVQLGWSMAKDNKYVGTEWRAKPQYQGGFLLDGGVHFTAAIRKLLGKENAIESLVAQTSLVSDHLPQVDSINAVCKTKSGAVGSYIQSCGTTLHSFDFRVACEQGHVMAEGAKVIVARGTGKDAKVEEKTWERTSGVKEEVRAWAGSLISGKPHAEQAPELALGDLELMEAMLTSGDQDGAQQKLEFQHHV